MEMNEIMNNEEIMETTAEEIAKKSSGKGFKIGVGIGIALLVGTIAYKYVGKPMIAKIKAKKEEKEVIDVEASEIEFEENNPE